MSTTAEFESCECIAQSNEAILVRIPEQEDPVWIPQSQVHSDSEVWKLYDKGTLVITEWIAIQKGLV
jgi:hypothetical protein